MYKELDAYVNEDELDWFFSLLEGSTVKDSFRLTINSQYQFVSDKIEEGIYKFRRVL